MEERIRKKQTNKIHRHAYPVPIAKISKPKEPIRDPKSRRKVTSKHVVKLIYVTKQPIDCDKFISPIIKNGQNSLHYTCKAAKPCLKHQLALKDKTQNRMNLNGKLQLKNILRKDNSSV
ncbi:MAG: hypothetical protein IKJ57_04370 [Oscillospiraceae bacterium]|nr:hypothetical protein [Oscillospiraceae bacterium]